MKIKKFTADEIAALDAEALATLHTETVAGLDALLALDAPSVEQVAEAEAHAGNRDLIEARQADEASAADRFAALKARKFASAKAEADGEEVSAEAESDEGSSDEGEGSEDEGSEGAEEEDGEDAGSEGGETSAASKTTKAATGTVRRLAAKQRESEQPTVRSYRPVTITASNQAPNLQPGAQVSLEQVGQAVLDRAGSFSTPNGDGKGLNLQRYGTAKFAIDFPDDMIVDSLDENAEAAIEAACDESRLPQGSLVAAGGWCAPSETVYDLDQDATTEGMLSLPEIGVRRGGLRFPVRPEFADFYANPGFKQTEAQNIAGNSKPCITIPCPSFTDVRLDVEGICIKVDILAEVGYPENVANYVSGTLVAHQHWINADVIGRVVTAAGTARDIAGLGDTATDLLEGLIRIIDERRQVHRLSMAAAMEVLLPFWVKNMLKADIARRTGRPAPAVKDSEVTDIFAAANANVQWLYDWQSMTPGATAYPSTFQAVVYPAGTFVKGTQPVITLDTVYDAASLAVNTYTGLFTEQAYLVAKRKLGADLLTFHTHLAGRTGINDLTN